MDPKTSTLVETRNSNTKSIHEGRKSKTKSIHEGRKSKDGKVTSRKSTLVSELDTVEAHAAHVLETQEVEALAHKLSLVEVMLSLEKEVFQTEFEGKKEGSDEEDLPAFVEHNPGCWVFGHGDITDLPHEFSNPILVTRFCCSLLLIMLTCTAFRIFWITLVIFVEPIHNYMYTAKFYGYPLLGFFFIHVVITVITHLSMSRKYLYLAPLNLITFFIAELAYTCTQVFISLAFERAAQVWFVSLDLYEDFKNNGAIDAYAPEFWPQLRLTPAIFLIIANVQIFINLTCAVFMDIYTTSRVGSPEMYRMLAIQSLVLTLFSVVIVQSFSYRISPVWDALQGYVGGAWAVFTSLIFIHYLERILRGQLLRLRGMRWTDICFAALRIIFT